MRRLMKPSMTIWPAERAGQRRVLARAEQRDRKQRARHRRAEQRREQLVGVADFGHVLVAGAVKGGGGHHEDRGVDEEREHQRDGGIDRRELDGLALPAVVSAYLRVCTIEECRYRLCGITVAPRMPIAM